MDKHLSLPEVGVFLTPPSTPAVKQEPQAGPAVDCSRGEDGLLPVPAHQPYRQEKPRHNGSTGPPPASLEYTDARQLYEAYYSTEHAEPPPSIFSFPSPESPRPDLAPAAVISPEHHYNREVVSPASCTTPPAGNTSPPTEQQPHSPRYDMVEKSCFQPVDTQLSDRHDAQSKQMTVCDTYTNGDFNSWNQNGNIGSVEASVFGNYHSTAMSPVSMENTSPVQSPPATVHPMSCYPPPYTAEPLPDSQSAITSPSGKVAAHFSHDCGNPDPDQTFDFPAPFAVPHDTNVDTLRHREAVGIPSLVATKQPALSEQQLDRFLRQTRREFSDLLSTDEPTIDRQQAVRSMEVMSCRTEGHHPVLERPASPRQHPQQPGLTDRDLEEVQTLIMQEVSRDIEVAFKVVQVPRDPRTWSHNDVARWLTWTADQYRLPNVYLECFPLDGAQLCDLVEREFVYRAPESGQILFALLEIWKSGMTSGPSVRSTVCTINKKTMSFTNPYMPNLAPYPGQDATPPHTEKAVHLWQFLRELLSQPESYSRFIRWMDRGKGIFKIEDSVQVARLWGIRKSRPAMNYDKLSRSIRQYYKKGIIRKPDQAQRLVYQFVKH